MDDVKDGGIASSTRVMAGVPWTNVYGLSRSLIALSTLSSLVLHDPRVLFMPFGQRMSQLSSGPAVEWSLFAVVPSLQAARLAAILVLLAVIIGIWPRITGVLHWYVSLSFVASAFVVEGGDQIAAILTLLLIPVTLTDPRRSHWTTLAGPAASLRHQAAAAVAGSAMIMIRVQMAIIYFHAAIGKWEAPEWSNGTALYYWIQHPLFGASPWLRKPLLAGFAHPTIVVGGTWGVIAFEFLLASALFWDKRKRGPLLFAGVLFHFGIILLHGLGSFFLVMSGGLLMYLSPWTVLPTDEFSWLRQIASRVRTLMRRPRLTFELPRSGTPS